MNILINKYSDALNFTQFCQFMTLYDRQFYEVFVYFSKPKYIHKFEESEYNFSIYYKLDSDLNMIIFYLKPLNLTKNEELKLYKAYYNFFKKQKRTKILYNKNPYYDLSIIRLTKDIYNVLFNIKLKKTILCLNNSNYSYLTKIYDLKVCKILIIDLSFDLKINNQLIINFEHNKVLQNICIKNDNTKLKIINTPPNCQLTFH